MSEHEPLPYIAPRRVVALCYQPSSCDIASSTPLLGSACAQFAVIGSAGGLVVAEPESVSDSRSPVAHLSAVLGVPLSTKAPFVPHILPTPDACSPAAVYPPRYGRLRVQLLTSSAVAEQHVHNLLSWQDGGDVASHLLPPLPIPSQPLQSANDLTAYVTQLLSDKQSKASVLVVHVTHDVLEHSQSGATDERLLPTLLDECLGQLLKLVDGGAGPAETADGELSDVYLCAIRLQPSQYTSPLASSPLASFVPKQSYQLSVPTASSTSAPYLPLLSFHHNTTRSDECVHKSRPQQFALGSGGLIGAPDWLAELAFRLGGKAKYGA